MSRARLSPAPEKTFKDLADKVLVRPTDGLIRSVVLRGIHPVTALRTMKRAVEQACDAIPGPRIERAWDELLQVAATDPRALGAPPVPAPRARIEQILCAHFDDLDREIPLGTVALLTTSGLGRPRRTTIALRTETYRQDAAYARGPKRSDALAAFALHVLESEYAWALRIIETAARLARREQIEPAPSLGNLLHQLRDRGALGELLWRDASDVRNAIAHDGRWQYVPKPESIIVRDRDPTRRPKRYQMAALFEKVTEASRLSSKLHFVCQRAIARDMMGVLGPAFGVWARTRDERPLIDAHEAFRARLGQAFATLASLGWRLP